MPANDKVVQDRQKIISVALPWREQTHEQACGDDSAGCGDGSLWVNWTKQPLHVHSLIEDIVDNYALQLDEKNGGAELSLSPEDLVEGDPVHFRNLISNLIDNAVNTKKTTCCWKNIYQQYWQKSYYTCGR